MEQQARLPEVNTVCRTNTAGRSAPVSKTWLVFVVALLCLAVAGCPVDPEEETVADEWTPVTSIDEMEGNWLGEYTVVHANEASLKSLLSIGQSSPSLRIPKTEYTVIERVGYSKEMGEVYMTRIVDYTKLVADTSENNPGNTKEDVWNEFKDDSLFLFPLSYKEIAPYIIADAFSSPAAVFPLTANDYIQFIQEANKGSLLEISVPEKIPAWYINQFAMRLKWADVPVSGVLITTDESPTVDVIYEKNKEFVSPF
jgi:hypothetical protein